MFNGILKSDDVEVIDTCSETSNISLSDNCKSNILIIGATGSIQLPQSGYVGQVINITTIYGTIGNGKTSYNSYFTIKHSNTTLFGLKQGTVSFMYVGQQLNGLTATDKAKSGWIILGGVQGDTAITGYAGSVAIGSGAYCSGASGVALGTSVAAASSSVAIGASTGATGTSATALGVNAQAYAPNSIALGTGANVNASATYGVAIGDSCAVSARKVSFKANNQFSTSGDAQAGKFILMRQTTDATPLVMSSANTTASGTTILTLPNNGIYAFKGIVVAKDASTLDSAMWEVTALMKRGANASTTALVGTPTVTKVFNDAGAAAWTIALTADTTNGGGAITVTGEAGKTIRWVCNVDSAELI